MIKNNLVIDRTILSYASKGDTGPALIMLHGNSLSSETFMAQFDDVLLEGFRLLAFDFPGHGQSSYASDPATEYNLFAFRDLMVEAVEKLGLDQFILMGHSLGGHVAMECLPLLPACKGIFLWGAPPVKLPLNTEELFNPIPESALLFTEKLTAADIRKLARLLGCEAHLQSISSMIECTDPAFRQYLPLSFGMGKVSDEYQLLKQSGIPVAIVQGASDQLISMAYLKSLDLPMLWRNNILMLKNACHSPQMDHPTVFNNLIVQFANDCFFC